MATAICCGGSTWFTEIPIDEARMAVETGKQIRVWWFSTNGQRYTEDAWFPPEKVDLIRTESDDG